MGDHLGSKAIRKTWVEAENCPWPPRKITATQTMRLFQGIWLQAPIWRKPSGMWMTSTWRVAWKPWEKLWTVAWCWWCPSGTMRRPTCCGWMRTIPPPGAPQCLGWTAGPATKTPGGPRFWEPSSRMRAWNTATSRWGLPVGDGLNPVVRWFLWYGWGIAAWRWPFLGSGGKRNNQTSRTPHRDHWPKHTLFSPKVWRIYNPKTSM